MTGQAAAGYERVIAGQPPSRVRVGRLLAEELVPTGDLLVVDRRVLELHELPTALAGLPRHEVVGEEATKCFSELERLLDAIAAAGLDRGSRLVALGGGVTTDLAGLAAALYMRGIAWTAVPTTLLAQVDASVGGKTAIDLTAGKNLAGAFHPPTDVVVEPGYLATLPRLELLSGLGEVLKAAVLGARATDGAPLLELLEQTSTEDLLTAEPDLYGAIVTACIAHKADVVEADPREGGARKALNLGHTFGHAIELVAGYGRIPHGVAVAAGLHLALAAASRVGLLEHEDLAARLGTLTTRLELPGAGDPLGDLERAFDLPLDRPALADAMALDKKVHAGRPRFVLPRGLGEVALDVELDPALLSSLLA